MRARLDPLIPRLGRMHRWMLDAVVAEVLRYDLERGLVPGQVPHRCYRHGPASLAWEHRLLAELDRALEAVAEG